MDDSLSEYIIKANERRGFIIAHTITLERIIDEFVAEYFTDIKGRKIELIEMVISKINYSTKVNLLISILDKTVKDPIAKPLFQVFKKDLNKIAIARNRFAHDITNTNLSKEKMAEFEISLINFTNISRPINYTDVQIRNILGRIQHCIDYIEEILKHMQGGSPAAQTKE